MTRELIFVDAIGKLPHERSLTIFNDFATQHSGNQGSTKRVRLTIPGSESFREVEFPGLEQLRQELQAIVEDEVADPQQLLAIPSDIPRRMFHLSIGALALIIFSYCHSTYRSECPSP